MKNLKHQESLHDYVKEFSALTLEITDMSDKDLLFNFMDGLKPWAELELQLCGFEDLATAMAVAEQLVDLRTPKKDVQKPSSPCTMSLSGGDQQSTSTKEKPVLADKPYNYQHGKKPQGGPSYQGHQSTRRPPPVPCYLCNEKHWMSDCPTRKKITALIAKLSDSEESDEEKPTAVPRVVLGVEFLTQAEAALMPHINSLLILDEHSPCMVPVSSALQILGKQLSALQLYQETNNHEDSAASKGRTLVKYLTSTLELVGNSSPGRSLPQDSSISSANANANAQLNISISFNTNHISKSRLRSRSRKRPQLVGPTEEDPRPCQTLPTSTITTTRESECHPSHLGTTFTSSLRLVPVVAL